MESQDTGTRPSLMDDEMERLIRLAYAHARNGPIPQRTVGWCNMWKAVLERLFPSDRYHVTIESRQVELWNFDFLFVTRKQDSRKLLMALGSGARAGKDTAAGLCKRKLILSYLLDVGKEVEKGRRIYCLGFIGTEFGWGWMENKEMRGIDPTVEWADFYVVESHESLHRLAEHVGHL